MKLNAEKFPATSAERKKASQREAIKKILAGLENKFLAHEKIKERLLIGRSNSDAGEIDIISRLDLIDAVHENVHTSIQFDDHRRAARYLAELNLLCHKFLSGKR